MRFILAAMLLIASPAIAQVDAAKLGLHHESELGYIVVGGNAKSESFSGRQHTWYQMEKDLAGIKAHYLRSSALNPQTREVNDTARNWSVTGRWEHIYQPEKWSVFAETGVLGNKFIGLELGRTGSLGVKYVMISSETFKWFAEFGYQYLHEEFIEDFNPVTQEYREAHFARLYSKAEYTYSPTVKFGLWAEYQPDVKDSENYRINFGPDVLVMLNDTFSLKFGYEGYYRNIPVSPNTIRFDFRHVTALIAKF